MIKPDRHTERRRPDQATDVLVELTLIPSDLATLYWAIAEVSLPDVENGYFVHPASLVADHFRDHGAVQIDGEEPALVFASNGGGHLFALAGSGLVWRSTTASWFDQLDLAADSLREFLEELYRQINSLLRPLLGPDRPAHPAQAHEARSPGRPGPADRDQLPDATMNREETTSYIKHHLTSRGLPRSVNNIAWQSLIAAFTQDKGIVDESSTRLAITETHTSN